MLYISKSWKLVFRGFPFMGMFDWGGVLIPTLHRRKRPYGFIHEKNDKMGAKTVPRGAKCVPDFHFPPFCTHMVGCAEPTLSFFNGWTHRVVFSCTGWLFTGGGSANPEIACTQIPIPLYFAYYIFPTPSNVMHWNVPSWSPMKACIKYLRTPSFLCLRSQSLAIKNGRPWKNVHWRQRLFQSHS